MRGLHVRLEAFSASYPYPFLRSGTQLTLPAPPLCSILGHLSACAGRVVGPEETAIAFEFRSEGTTVDLERTRRLRTSKTTGKLSTNPVQGLGYREFHVKPRLDLYLTELDFEPFLSKPAAVPCLGRSQDIAWIRPPKRVEFEPMESGVLGPTFVPFPNAQVGGQILPPLADYFVNERLGYTRRYGRLSRYQFVPGGQRVRATAQFRLFHPSDSEDPEHVVLFHGLKS